MFCGRWKSRWIQSCGSVFKHKDECPLVKCVSPMENSPDMTSSPARQPHLPLPGGPGAGREPEPARAERGCRSTCHVGPLSISGPAIWARRCRKKPVWLGWRQAIRPFFQAGLWFILYFQGSDHVGSITVVVFVWNLMRVLICHLESVFLVLFFFFSYCSWLRGASGAGNGFGNVANVCPEGPSCFRRFIFSALNAVRCRQPGAVRLQPQIPFLFI